jgi:hypothetical protein
MGIPLFDRSADLPDDYLAELGRIAVRWARLEADLGTAVAQLAFGSFPMAEHAAALTAHIPMRTRCDILRSLTAEIIKDSPLAEELELLLQEIQEVQGDRNDVIHSEWLMTRYKGAITKSPPTAVKVTARKGVETIYESPSQAELRVVADKITALAARLQDWTTRASSKRPTWP